MGASLSIEAETKSAGIKLAISRLSDEYLSFVEITTVEVSARKDEMLFLGRLRQFTPIIYARTSC